MFHLCYSGEEYEIRAKCVINATGPYTDMIRTMADKETRKICQPSSGVHVVLPDYYSPENMGLLDPATSDGRIIFFLPWQKVTLAGQLFDLTSLNAPQNVMTKVVFKSVLIVEDLKGKTTMSHFFSF